MTAGRASGGPGRQCLIGCEVGRARLLCTSSAKLPLATAAVKVAGESEIKKEPVSVKPGPVTSALRETGVAVWLHTRSEEHTGGTVGGLRVL